MISPLGGQPQADLLAGQGLATLRPLFGVFSYNYLVMLFFNMVCLTKALTKSDGKIVFFGGRNWGANGNPEPWLQGGIWSNQTNQIISYDVKDKIWTNVKTRNTPSPRSDMALVQVEDAVYIHGGWAADGPLADFWVLDLKAKAWTWTEIKVKEPSPGKKDYHSLAALSDDLLLLVGGWDNDHQRPSREVWTFNTTRKEWKLHDLLPKEALGNKAEGIYDHQAVSVVTSAVSVQRGNGERNVFVLGGNTEYQEDMETHQMLDVLKYETVC
jgi:hypothetical protein